MLGAFIAYLHSKIYQSINQLTKCVYSFAFSCFFHQNVCISVQSPLSFRIFYKKFFGTVMFNIFLYIFIYMTFIKTYVKLYLCFYLLPLLIRVKVTTNKCKLYLMLFSWLAKVAKVQNIILYEENELWLHTCIKTS